MPAKILDGRILAGQIQASLSEEVTRLKKKTGSVPALINVMIGQEAGSCAYAKSQERVAQRIGIRYECLKLPDGISQTEIINHIRQLNDQDRTHGIMIHKPFPKDIDYQKVANAIDVRKDLEGINVTNIGRMLLGETKMIPCTPAAVMEHIRSTRLSLRGKEVVIIGSSAIVGKPLSLLLLREMATVTVCHIGTTEAGHLEEHVARAEILIVAVGKAGLIQGRWIRPGAMVIDVGINKAGDTIVGDVEFAAAAQRAAFITPVPGGVGPVTVVMLMRNGIEAFKSQEGIE